MTSLLVCPECILFDDLKEVEAGRSGSVGTSLPAGCGAFGEHGVWGLCPGKGLDSDLGLWRGLGATMGLTVRFLSTAKGLGVSRGLGLGTGLLGSGVMRWAWPMRLLLESASGLR